MNTDETLRNFAKRVFDLTGRIAAAEYPSGGWPDEEAKEAALKTLSEAMQDANKLHADLEIAIAMLSALFRWTDCMNAYADASYRLSRDAPSGPPFSYYGCKDIVL